MEYKVVNWFENKDSKRTQLFRDISVSLENFKKFDSCKMRKVFPVAELIELNKKESGLCEWDAGYPIQLVSIMEDKVHGEVLYDIFFDSTHNKFYAFDVNDSSSFDGRKTLGESLRDAENDIISR